MSNHSSRFRKESEQKAFDQVHRKTIRFNMSKYDAAVAAGKKQYSNLPLARQRAAFLKRKVIRDLENYLITFESNFRKNGGKVIWASDAKDAIKQIVDVLQKAEVKKLVKSKSMISEEIEFNEALSKNDIESIETDLGEYIVQVKDEKPYHIVTPAMHLSKEDIALLFHEKFNTDKDATPEQLTIFVREILREKFTSADTGVTGANFLLADTGSVCLTENEGNGLMSVSFPKIHIVIAGIEKIISSIEDLDLFWPLLATHGTGQTVTVYNSIISGPKKENETDGPDEMYVVLLDNNRTKILEKEQQYLSLSCIRCGACLNACPVYRNIGGHTYNTPYSGPIGSVISPHMMGLKNYKHLSFASSLCGKCTEVCPVNIPLHEFLLENRKDSTKEGHVKGIEKFGMRAATKALKSRKLMNYGGGIKNFAMKRFFKKTWGPRRDLPYVQKKTFNKLWKERNAD